MKTDDFADKMERIADLWAEEMIHSDASDVTGELHVNRFKALTTYLVQTRKLGRRQFDDEDAGFGSIKRAIAEGNANAGRQ